MCLHFGQLPERILRWILVLLSCLHEFSDHRRAPDVSSWKKRLLSPPRLDRPTDQQTLTEAPASWAGDEHWLVAIHFMAEPFEVSHFHMILISLWFHISGSARPGARLSQNARRHAQRGPAARPWAGLLN